MNKSFKIDQSSFLHVKQRLDYYYLPSDFPIEVTHLLAKLLSMLDSNNNQRIYQKQNLRYQQAKKSNQTNLNPQVSCNFHPAIDEALKMQINKHIKENNVLHREIMTLKQEISNLKHIHSKQRIQNNTSGQIRNLQLQWLQNNKFSRQKQLLQELQQIKYKYNQLMDLVHNEEPKIEKEFIKRLMKYKQYEIGGKNNDTQTGMAQQIKTGERTMKRVKRGQTTDEYSRNQANLQNKAIHTSSSHYKYVNYQISLLNEKLQNRQKQILRLQRKLQFDGINMNKVLKDFNQSKQKQSLSKIQQRVQHLQKQNKLLKDQNNKTKKQGGDKQALRQHVDKLKNQNLELKQKLQKQKLKLKQVSFDQKKQRTKTTRKLNQTASQLQSVIKQNCSQKTKIEQFIQNRRVLQNRIQQLQKQLSLARVQNQNFESEICNLRKQLQSEKLMGAYEMQKHNRKQGELRQKIGNTERENDNNLLNNLNLLKENELLKESVVNLEKLNQELMRKNSSIVDSTNYLQKSIIELQNAQLYKQKISQLKNKLYYQQGQIIKRQRQYQSRNVLYERSKKQNELLKQENKILNKITIQYNINQQTLNQLKKEKILLRQSWEIQKDKNIKLQAQIQQLQFTLDKVTRDFHVMKDQYYTLQKTQKQTIRSLQLTIAEMEEVINVKTAKLQQKQIRIKNLQCQLIQCTQRLRQSNRQLSSLDDQLHKLKMQKSRLDRKHSQMIAQYTILKQKTQNTSSLKQLQLKADIEKLARQSQHNKLLQDDLQGQIHELIEMRSNLQNQMQSSQRQLQQQRLQIKNYKNREGLYEMEIRELKQLTKFDE